MHLKRELDLLIVASIATREIAPERHRVAQAATGLPSRSMMKVRRPKLPFVHCRRHIRKDMMRGATVQKFADWLRSNSATPVDYHRRQAHRICRLAVVLKQADDFLPVVWIDGSDFDEDKQEGPIK